MNQNELLRMFAAYIGCEVEYPETDRDKKKPVKAKLTGVSTDEVTTTYKRKKNRCMGDLLSWQSNRNHNSDALHMKLILTSLSKITDEHAIEVAKMEGNDYDTYPMDGKRYKVSDKEAIAFTKSDIQNGYLLLTCWNYLREKGYDCDGLIAAGYAIEKTN